MGAEYLSYFAKFSIQFFEKVPYLPKNGSFLKKCVSLRKKEWVSLKMEMGLVGISILGLLTFFIGVPTACLCYRQRFEHTSSRRDYRTFSTFAGAVESPRQQTTSSC